jgi:TATA-box binding protein (TBP) (component of TFIID and TFIIIB)
MSFESAEKLLVKSQKTLCKAEETMCYKSYPKKEDIRVATMTLISKINCYIDIQRVIANVKLEDGKIEKIKFGKKKTEFGENEVSIGPKESIKAFNSPSSKNLVQVEELKINPDETQKKVRKNKKKKKNFYNQVTIIIKPFPSRQNGVNMKLSENGSIQMTGGTSIEEGHLTIRKMIEYLNQWDSSIFYRRPDAQDDTSFDSVTTIEKTILSQHEQESIEILFMRCELIIVSFEIPFYIHLKKFDELLKSKYNLLSILGTSSYPGINTKMTYNLECKHSEHIKKKKKYMCDCRDMSIFTFRTGKVIITGFENLEKIKVIFERYINIVKFEEEQIKITNTITAIPSKNKKNKIMKINGKVFEIVEDF